MQRHQTTTAALEDVAGSGNGPGAAAGAAGRGDHKTAAALEYAGGGGSEAGDGPGTAAGATGRGDQKMVAALEDTDSARARARVPARMQQGRRRRRGTTVTVPARVLSTSVFLLGRGPGRIHSWELLALCSVSSDLQWMDGCARLQNTVERADCSGSGSQNLGGVVGGSIEFWTPLSAPAAIGPAPACHLPYASCARDTTQEEEETARQWDLLAGGRRHRR